MAPPPSGYSSNESWIELENLEMLVFGEKGKLEYLEKNLTEQRKNQQQTQPTYSGLEIATNTVAFATQFFPFATKIYGEVANLRLIFPLLFRNKKVTSYRFAAT